MAFGITREELNAWKQTVLAGEIAFVTHYWYDARFPDYRTVTKVGCADIKKLSDWCISHGLDPVRIHQRERYPHFDLMGSWQLMILKREGLHHHIERFGLEDHQ